MEAVIQVVVSGLLAGTDYVLSAVGMTLIFGVRLPVMLVGRFVVNTERVLAAGVAAAILGTMALYLRTRPGLAWRAAAADPEIAALAGVDVGRVQTATFAAACAMAAVAGTFLSPL